ncbi:hypothetical protein AGMMS50276_00880 [Synergistales bacterium]|nr:hypothetical protein AGMMS50276_00880 [Synergistales bacterium]
MDEKQHKLLIDRIVQEVLHRIKMAKTADECVSGTVVLMTSHVPSPKSALSKLRQSFGKDMLFLNLGIKNPFSFEKVVESGADGDDNVASAVAGAANVVLLTPKIGLLESIAKGLDDDFVPHLVIRSLLWRRNVSVVLDFEPPRFKRNTFYEKLVDVLGTLRDMGANLLTYKCATQKDMEGLTLVTEADVMDAWKNKRLEIRCAIGAIVTPSARDKSKELGIRIN